MNQTFSLHGIKEVGKEDLLPDFTKSRDNLVYSNPWNLPPNQQPTYEYKKGELRYNDNVKLGGYLLKDIEESDPVNGYMNLLDLIVPMDRHINFKFSQETFSFFQSIHDQVDLFSVKVEICFRLKGFMNKRYWIKRTTYLNGVSSEGIYSNISYLEDITFLKPTPGTYWKLSGERSEYFDFDIPEVASYQEILTPQEVKIVRLLARGLTSSLIGERLYISKHTVDTHRRKILKKLEANNTPHLLDISRDLGVI